MHRCTGVHVEPVVYIYLCAHARAGRACLYVADKEAYSALKLGLDHDCARHKVVDAPILAVKQSDKLIDSKEDPPHLVQQDCDHGDIGAIFFHHSDVCLRAKTFKKRLKD